MLRTLETDLWLPRPIDEVFAFFADADNLQRITPPLLNFRIVTPMPIPMAAGTLIDYRISLRGFPMRWRTLISVWEPPFRFVDEQLKGPYSTWIHEHTFARETREGVEGTRCKDIVRYASLGGGIIHRVLVRPDLERIFRYRQAAMLEIMGV